MTLWLDPPEKAWFRQLCFQMRLWIGAAGTLYVPVMSASGSMIVHRNELSVWTLTGLVPAVPAFTAIFMCCRRVMFNKPSSPNRAAG